MSDLLTAERILGRLNPTLDEALIAEILRAHPAGARLAPGYFASHPGAKKALTAEAPDSIRKLVSSLHNAGGSFPTQPQCPRCNYRRYVGHKLADGTLACRRCYSRERVAECSKCGKVKQIYRLQDSAALCKSCAAPWTNRSCAQCGYVGSATRRVDGTDVCLNCAPSAAKLCHLCGRVGKIAANMLGGLICMTCYHKVLRHPSSCPKCAGTRILAHLDPSGLAICATCAGIPARYACARCGSEQFHIGRLCATCRIEEILAPLLQGHEHEAGIIRLREYLLAQPNRYNTLKWLTRSPHRELFKEVVSGKRPRSHDSLKHAKNGAALSYLRNLLVTTGVLPYVDPKFAPFEAWVSTFTKTVHPDDQAALSAYARWVLVHRMRVSAEKAPLTGAQVGFARSQLRQAARFQQWLRQRAVTLQDTRPHHLDAYIAGTRNPQALASFVRWCSRQYGLPLTITTRRTLGASPTISESRRQQIASEILWDRRVTDDARLLILIVATFGVGIASTLKMDIGRLRFENRDTGWISFTDHETQMPAWMAPLAFDQSERSPSRWLFPGKWEGTHRTPQSFALHLRKYDVTLRELQIAARFHLASHMNTSLLSDTIGFAPGTIAVYRQLSGGWWSDAFDMYAHN